MCVGLRHSILGLLKCLRSVVNLTSTLNSIDFGSTSYSVTDEKLVYFCYYKLKIFHQSRCNWWIQNQYWVDRTIRLSG